MGRNMIYMGNLWLTFMLMTFCMKHSLSCSFWLTLWPVTRYQVHSWLCWSGFTVWFMIHSLVHDFLCDLWLILWSVTHFVISDSLLWYMTHFCDLWLTLWSVIHFRIHPVINISPFGSVCRRRTYNISQFLSFILALMWHIEPIF